MDTEECVTLDGANPPIRRGGRSHRRLRAGRAAPREIGASLAEMLTDDGRVREVPAELPTVVP